MVATTDKLMAGIIQATQDIIQGLTVSAGLYTLKQKLYFSCASHQIIKQITEQNCRAQDEFKTKINAK